MASIVLLKREFLEIGSSLGLQGEALVTYVSDESRKELERLEREKEKEIAFKEREMQLLIELEREKNKGLEISNEINPTVNSPTSNLEVLTNESNMNFHMEIFKEKEESIDNYLNRFEALAELHQLAEEKWALKLSLSLRGLAYDIYSHLPFEEKNEYKLVKQNLYKHFQVTAEQYRKKFRTIQKETHESYRQLSSKLKLYLTKWLRLSNLEETYEDMVTLCLIEQLKSIMSPDTKRFIDEQGAKDLENILVLADQYIEAQEANNAIKKPLIHTPSNIMHGNNYSKPPGCFDGSKQNYKPYNQNQKYCRNCKNNSHNTHECKKIHKPNTLAITKAQSKHCEVTKENIHPPVTDTILVNGKTATVLYDTGLDYHCVIATHLVKPEQLTDETIKVQCATWNQEPMELPIANIHIECPYVVGKIPAARVSYGTCNNLHN